MFYVDASSEQTIEADLESIAVEKKVGESATDAMRWMESQEDWLLILDNADDPRLDLSRFIPHTPHGNTIITSRNAQTRTYGLPSGAYREITNMAPEEAKELFLRRAGLLMIGDQPRTLDDREDEVVRAIVRVRLQTALFIIHIYEVAAQQIRAGARIFRPGHYPGIRIYCEQFYLQSREISWHVL